MPKLQYCNIEISYSSEIQTLLGRSLILSNFQNYFELSDGSLLKIPLLRICTHSTDVSEDHFPLSLSYITMPLLLAAMLTS